MKCQCKTCHCSVEGLGNYSDWICPFCKAGNHITETKVDADLIKK
jgi:hypothetical protein